VDLKDTKQDSSSTSLTTDLLATVAAAKDSLSLAASSATTVVADVRSPAKSVDLVSSKKDTDSVSSIPTASTPSVAPVALKDGLKSESAAMAGTGKNSSVGDEAA